MEEMDMMDCLVQKGKRETQEFKDSQGHLDLKVQLDTRERRETLVLLVTQDPMVEGWHTPGGGRPHAQTSTEHNSCMQEELLEAILPTKVVEPTTSV